MAFRETVTDAVRRTLFSPVVLGVAAMSVVLTAAFVGLLGVLSGAQLDVGSRLPAYVFVMGVVFVVAVLRLDAPDRPGPTVLAAVSGIAALAFVLTALATEGVFYTRLRPDQVITSQLVVYFAAAGLVCTGVVIWTLHHWREFATDAPPT